MSQPLSEGSGLVPSGVRLCAPVFVPYQKGAGRGVVRGGAILRNQISKVTNNAEFQASRRGGFCVTFAYRFSSPLRLPYKSAHRHCADIVSRWLA